MRRHLSGFRTLYRSIRTAAAAAIFLALGVVAVQAQSRPVPPSNLTAMGTSPSSIHLMWRNNDTGRDQLRIEIWRSRDGITFSPDDSIACSAGFCSRVTYDDIGLLPHTLYFYRVRLCTSGRGCSDFSNNASSRTFLASPVLQLVSVRLRSISLAWTSVDADQFQVERSTDGTNFITIATVPGSQLSYTDGPVSLGMTYFYRVTATMGVSFSRSNVVQATTGTLVLSLVNVRLGSISVAWTPVTPDQYRVERSFDGTFFSTIATVPGTQINYTDSSVVLGTTYFYRVTAVAGTDSVPSNIVQATTESLTLSVASVRLRSINLAWTSPTMPVDQYRLERSTDGINFTVIAIIFPPQTTYTDSHLALATNYFYRMIAVRGTDSGTSNRVGARTDSLVLQVVDVCLNSANLAWTALAVDSYTLDRSTDGTKFATIAKLPGGQSKYSDSGLDQGSYFYRVTAVLGDDSGASNVTRATIGPVGINHPTDFSDHSDLTANGNATFPPGNTARLTDTSTAFQVSTIFSDQRMDIRKFATSFTFKIHDGTTPPADGMTFIIQRNSPTAIGQYGGGLGYGFDFPNPNFRGIRNSVAVKFDIYDNAGEGTNSTGLFTDGRSPTIREPGLPPEIPDRSVDLTGTSIELKNANPKRVDLTYDGTTLTEKITDLVTSLSVTIPYAVDIPSFVGGDSAYVGFGGGTGGFAAVQDVLNWTYNSDSSGLPPRVPSHLGVRGVPAEDQITIGWCDNDTSAQGDIIEQSTDGVSFTEVARVDPGVSTYTDMGLAPGAYCYRVRTFNDQGNSVPSNVDCVLIPVANVDHSAGFDTHDDLTNNGSAQFVGTFAQLTDGVTGNQAGSIFFKWRVGIANFTTSFTLQMLAGTMPMADGMTFTIQGNDPTALGGGGGGLGYGFDFPGPGRGIRNSVAVKFDLYNNAGEGVNSTGLFTDGRSPTVRENGLPDTFPDISIDLTGTGIDLNSQDPFQVDMSYDGASLVVTITDTTTSASATQTYAVDIPSFVGGTLGYVGWTGGTGGLTALQNVQSWTFQSSSVSP